MLEQTLTSILLGSALRFPARTALITPQERLTYAELFDRALRLSSYLVESGLRPSDRVAICLPKGAELSVAIFGALLAGASYVPIDYTMPAARALLILTDAAPSHLVTTQQAAAALFPDGGHGGEVAGGLRQQVVLPLRQGPPTPRVAWSEVLACAPLPTPVPVSADSLAYVLYTSGSTGKPKGVMQSHRSAVAFVEWTVRHLGLTPEDVLSQHASPSFDLTIFDFFASALAGAALVPVPEWLFGQVGRTCRFIVKQGITVWYSVPSVLLRPEESAPLRQLSGSRLRHVVFAGEVIPKPGLRELARHLPAGCSLSNWFGPTETNVCTFHDIGPDDLATEAPVPIGLPCPYAEVRLEGPEGESTDEGELLVASPTVLEGYWGLEELSARVFHTGADGQKYYRTGDIVRFESGRLVFLGRRDRMVKVRGYRVQLEELEHALREHPAVTEAAVVAFEEDGVQQLGAAIVLREPSEALTDEVRLHCSARLPSYMVPSRLLRLDALPRNNRGKVDTHEVRRLVTERSASPEAPAPRNLSAQGG